MNALRYLPFVARVLRRSGPPLHLTVFVTGRCNARCRHCFHWREVAAGVAGPSAEQLGKLADSAARMGPLLWVSFGGGEPFLRADLAELARAFGRHGLRHLAIPTNGLVEDRMHEAVERILAENPELHLSVSVSFDGPEAIHDSIRQVPGGHARSRASVKRLKEQQRRHPRLGVGMLVTLTSENELVLSRHLEALVDELHPDNVTLNLARGTAMEPHLLKVDLDRYRELVATKARLVREKRLPYFDFPLARLAVARDELMYEQVEHQARGLNGRFKPCTAAELSAVVFENGSVHPCEILGREIGNLNAVDWDLAKLWHSEEAAALRREILATRCACTWECAQADNVLFDAKSWPRLIAKSLAR
ncbi:MAG: radical SAM protein [Planctomycetes bacterium]|nr:radical SAM protein [Planctomycetota bacterium]